jgi:hypothetical protein
VGWLLVIGYWLLVIFTPSGGSIIRSVVGWWVGGLVTGYWLLVIFTPSGGNTIRSVEVNGVLVSGY